MTNAVAVNRPLPDSPVARLRPRTVGQIIDGGFDVMRYRFANSIVLAAIAGLPLIAVPTIIYTAIADRTSSGLSLDTLGDRGDTAAAADGVLWLFVTFGGSALATAIVGVWQARQVIGWVHGEDPEVRTVLRGTAPRLGILLVTWICLLPVRALGFGCFTLFVNPLFAVLSAVVAVEGTGPWTSVKRAVSIAGRRYGQFLAIFLLLVAANIALSYGTVALSALIEQVASIESLRTVLVTAIGIAVQLVMICVNASVAALAYLDARVRTEGLDLELDIDLHFGDAQ